MVFDRLIFSDVHVVSESSCSIVGGKCWQTAVQVTCSSSVFFWNGYSVLGFSLNMHFYFFWACCCQKHSLKYYKALPKKKKNSCSLLSRTINDETIVTRVFKLHAVYSPAGWPLLYFLHTLGHKYLIFPDFHLPRWLVN